MANMIQLNLGKKGLTPEFLENLKLLFTNVEHARISLLKSSSRNKEQVKAWAEEIVNKLGKNFTYKIIGYTIVLRKWRKGKDARA
jgi:RNA-binding protein YhbY